MLKLNSKRGGTVELVLMPAMIMLLAVGFFMLVFNWASQIGESELFEKEFLAKDIALLIDSMYAVPGQAIIYYPEKTFDLKIELSKNKVEVYKNKTDFLKKRFYFTEDNSIPIDYKVIEPSNLLLTFTKKNRISVERGSPDISTVSVLTCQYNIETTDTTEKTIGIDSQGDTDDLRDLLILQVFGRNQLITFKKLSALKDIPDGIIGLNDIDEKRINIYYLDSSSEKEKAQKMACFISNSLSTELNYQNVVMAPLNINEIPEGDFKNSLNNNKIAVYIEIDKDLLVQKIREIPMAVYKAIKKYYE